MFRSREFQLAAVLLSACSFVAAGPCDIYAAGNTPCVAAHSTTRALYKAFAGALYQITRTSDGTTTTIQPFGAGRVADTSGQDSFCAGTTCLISIIYDQSGNGNHLFQAPPGGNGNGSSPNGYDNLASAYGAPVTLHGHKVYGVFSPPGTGYRNDNTTGVALGNDPEGLYAVFDSTNYNNGCCFDYGNAETTNDVGGDGSMESIYFGDGAGYAVGAGNGPWVMADLEFGLYPGGSEVTNPRNPSQTARFVQGIVKGNSSNHFAIRGGSATSGKLSTYYSGVRPNGYYPMQKKGGIILGIGGDNSLGAQGTFYEGAMTVGYPSDKTENRVQANIKAAKYLAGSYNTGPPLAVGSTITFHVTTPGYTTRYIAHNGSTVQTEVITSSSPQSLQQQGSWNVVQGLWYDSCYSFESVDTPGSYIRQSAFELYLNANDGSTQFAQDATFCVQSALNGQGNSIRSWSYPTRYFRHYQNVGYLASDGGAQEFDSAASFTNDVSFLISDNFEATR